MKYTFSPSTYFLRRELEKRGYKVVTYDDPYLLYVEKNGKHIYTHASKTFATSALFFVCKDKYLTRQVLEQFDFPVPRGMKINREETDKASELVFPVVVKPLMLSGGEGIAIGLRSVDEIKEYWHKHPDYSEVVVEEMLRGEDARLLVVGGKFFAACKRCPAQIVGDGSRTIKEIIVAENEVRSMALKSQEERGVYETNTYPILLDEDVDRVLAAQYLSLTSVPAAGEEITVRSNANVSTGGISVDVTPEVGPEIRELAEKIAQVFGATTLGIDIMTEDLSQPLDITRGWGIVEVNGSPGLALHALAHRGERRDPTPTIVDEIDAYFATL